MSLAMETIAEALELLPCYTCVHACRIVAHVLLYFLCICSVYSTAEIALVHEVQVLKTYFENVFDTCLYPFFQYNSSLKVILSLQASFRIHESNHNSHCYPSGTEWKGAHRKERVHHHF